VFSCDHFLSVIGVPGGFPCAKLAFAAVVMPLVAVQSQCSLLIGHGTAGNKKPEK